MGHTDSPKLVSYIRKWFEGKFGFHFTFDKNRCSAHLSRSHIVWQRCGWQIWGRQAGHHSPKTDCRALNLQQEGSETEAGTSTLWIKQLTTEIQKDTKTQNQLLCLQPATIQLAAGRVKRAKPLLEYFLFTHFYLVSDWSLTTVDIVCCIKIFLGS